MNDVPFLLCSCRTIDFFNVHGIISATKSEVSVDGQSYHMNSQSGQIFGISGVSAVLSEENLQEVLSLLANE